MASVDYTKIRLGCRAKIKPIPNLPEVVWENRSAAADVPGKTTVSSPEPLFIKEEIIKSRAIKSSMGYLEVHPTVVYSVHTAVGRGTELAEEWAKKLNDVFQVNTVVLFDGYEMIIERAYQGDPYEDNEGKRTNGVANWYVSPVLIVLRLHVSDPV